MSSQNPLDGAGRQPSFACRWRREGGTAASVQVSGEIDLATAPEFEAVLRDVSAHAPLVVIDLSAVTFMGSSGIHVLVGATERGHRSGTRMVIVGASTQVQRVLELTGTQDVLNALPVLSEDLEHLFDHPAVGEREAGLRPLDNPVNASVIAGRVMAIPNPGLWLQAHDGTILRAWAPTGTGSPVLVGATVDIYLDRRGAVNGWRHADSGVSINQRRLRPGSQPATAVPLACHGSCGVIWQAPAARQLTEHDEHCLTCAGPLAPA